MVPCTNTLSIAMTLAEKLKELEIRQDDIEKLQKQLTELISLLSDHAGETGKNEGAVDVLKRIIEKAEKWDKSQNYFLVGEFGAMKGVKVSLDELLESIEIVERLKKRIEELNESIHDEWKNYEVEELLQKILDGKE